MKNQGKRSLDLSVWENRYKISKKKNQTANAKPFIHSDRVSQTSIQKTTSKISTQQTEYWQAHPPVPVAIRTRPTTRVKQVSKDLF
jgi:hypothetical protein